MRDHGSPLIANPVANPATHAQNNVDGKLLLPQNGTMSQKLLVALISGGAAFLGALIAALITFAGTRATNRQTLKVAREQRSYDIAREKCGVILPEIYLRLSDLLVAFRSLVSVSFTPSEERDQPVPRALAEFAGARSAASHQLDEKARELLHFHKRNAVWIPEDLDKSISSLNVALRYNAMTYRKQIFRNLEWAKESADRQAWKVEIQEISDEQDRAVEEAKRRQRELLGSYEPSPEHLDELQAERDLDASVDEFKAESEIRSDEENRKILRSLGKTEDASTTSEDDNSQAEDRYEGMSPQDVWSHVYIEEYSQRHATYQKMFLSWLDGEATERLEEIHKLSREILNVEVI
jgi:hypothetical protein